MSDHSRESRYGLATRAIHAGAQPDPVTGARNVPIYQTTAYVFDDADHAASLFNLQTFGYIYTRITNPTVAALEVKVAALEGGRGAVAVASGHAAQLVAFYTLMEPGDRLRRVAVPVRRLDHPVRGHVPAPRLARHPSWTRANLDEVRAAITPTTKLIFVESLSNPAAVVADLEGLAQVAHEVGIPLVVDNTMASPALCRPFEWGADIVIHSMTKFLGGHGTSMGGIVVESGRFDWSSSGRFPGLSEPDPAYHGLVFHETFGDFGFSMKARAVALRDLGPALSPTNAFNIITGIETLPLRMERHVANGRAVAEHLDAHPAVAWVSYPGLPSSPDHALGKKYLDGGAGSVFTFGLKGGYQAGVRFVESVELWSHLANVGDTRSLVIHPASTTHRQLTPEQRAAAGAGRRRDPHLRGHRDDRRPARGPGPGPGARRLRLKSGHPRVPRLRHALVFASRRTTPSATLSIRRGPFVVSMTGGQRAGDPDSDEETDRWRSSCSRTRVAPCRRPRPSRPRSWRRGASGSASWVRRPWTRATRPHGTKTVSPDGSVRDDASGPTGYTIISVDSIDQRHRGVQDVPRPRGRRLGPGLGDPRDHVMPGAGCPPPTRGRAPGPCSSRSGPRRSAGVDRRGASVHRRHLAGGAMRDP